jgi:hypothetical protein
MFFATRYMILSEQLHHFCILPPPIILGDGLKVSELQSKKWAFFTSFEDTILFYRSFPPLGIEKPPCPASLPTQTLPPWNSMIRSRG